VRASGLDIQHLREPAGAEFCRQPVEHLGAVAFCAIGCNVMLDQLDDVAPRLVRALSSPEN
jgi:hypothetical protein